MLLELCNMIRRTQPIEINLEISRRILLTEILFKRGNHLRRSRIMRYTRFQKRDYQLIITVSREQLCICFIKIRHLPAKEILHRLHHFKPFGICTRLVKHFPVRDRVTACIPFHLFPPLPGRKTSPRIIIPVFTPFRPLLYLGPNRIRMRTHLLVCHHAMF